MSQLLTVMGPEPTSAHFSCLTPPKLTPETDKYQWRVDVQTWKQMVKLYAKGGDSRAKGMLNALALTLYFSLERNQRNIVDNAMQDRLVSLNTDDDAEEISTNAMARIQFECVDDIVNLVAKDTPTDGIRRLVKISQGIHKCVRINCEKPHAFARRFQGMAKQYLNMSNSANGEKESQNFAILLLENAQLPSSTFNNIVTQLVTKSSSKQGIPETATVTLPSSTFVELIRISTAASQALSSWESAITTTTTAHNSETHQLILKTKTLIETTNKIAEGAQKENTELVQKDRQNIFITLDDAVDAICDIKADEEIIALGNATQDPGLKKEQHIKQGSMMTKRKEADNSFMQPPQKKPYILPGTGKKKDSICMVCKKMGHWKGDYMCEEHPLHKQWLERQDKQFRLETNKNSSGNMNNYFQ